VVVIAGEKAVPTGIDMGDQLVVGFSVSHVADLN
jgi:hypothetical protein